MRRIETRVRLIFPRYRTRSFPADGQRVVPRFHFHVFHICETHWADAPALSGQQLLKAEQFVKA